MEQQCLCACWGFGFCDSEFRFLVGASLVDAHSDNREKSTQSGVRKETVSKPPQRKKKAYWCRVYGVSRILFFEYAAIPDLELSFETVSKQRPYTIQWNHEWIWRLLPQPNQKCLTTDFTDGRTTIRDVTEETLLKTHDSQTDKETAGQVRHFARLA